MIPPPVTQASIRREIRRRLKQKGYPNGYTPNPPACRPYDGHYCAEPDCEAQVSHKNSRCHICSATAQEEAARKRKREAWARSESKRKAVR